MVSGTKHLPRYAGQTSATGPFQRRRPLAFERTKRFTGGRLNRRSHPGKPVRRRSHTGHRLLPDSAARYGKPERPSSHLNRSVRDPTGSGSKWSMAWAWNVGTKPGGFWRKRLVVLGRGRKFVHGYRGFCGVRSLPLRGRCRHRRQRGGGFAAHAGGRSARAASDAIMPEATRIEGVQAITALMCQMATEDGERKFAAGAALHWQNSTSGRSRVMRPLALIIFASANARTLG